MSKPSHSGDLPLYLLKTAVISYVIRYRYLQCIVRYDLKTELQVFDRPTIHRSSSEVILRCVRGDWSTCSRLSTDYGDAGSEDAGCYVSVCEQGFTCSRYIWMDVRVRVLLYYISQFCV